MWMIHAGSLEGDDIGLAMRVNGDMRRLSEEQVKSVWQDLPTQLGGWSATRNFLIEFNALRIGAGRPPHLALKQLTDKLQPRKRVPPDSNVCALPKDLLCVVGSFLSQQDSVKWSVTARCIFLASRSPAYHSELVISPSAVGEWLHCKRAHRAMYCRPRVLRMTFGDYGCSTYSCCPKTWRTCKTLSSFLSRLRKTIRDATVHLQYLPFIPSQLRLERLSLTGSHGLTGLWVERHSMPSVNHLRELEVLCWTPSWSDPKLLAL